MRRAHHDFPSILVPKSLCVLENAHTRGFGAARQALGVFERMQMTAARVEYPAQIAIAAHVRLQLGAIEQARRAITVLVVQLMDPLLQFIEMPRLEIGR